MTIQGVVKMIEGERVTISFDDGQVLVIPREACEGTPKVEGAVRVIVAVLGSEDAGRQSLARELLNDILAP